MMVIEMREAAQDKAFELLDEIKDLGHKKKLAICELEDTLYDCFESSKEEDDREYEMDDHDDMEDDKDIEFRRRRSYRFNRRRMKDSEMDDDDEMNMRSYRRSSMRMRRNRMGRYV